MIKIPKKRNHKKALARRRAKIASSKAAAKERLWRDATESYVNNSKIMPMPTLVDALSTRDIKTVEPLSKGIESLLKYFNHYIQSTSDEYGVKVSLPSNVIAFIIPLDFYIPLPEPYNAMTISSPDQTISTANCITIISDIVSVGGSAVKVSYLIASICTDEYGDIEDINNPSVHKAFEKSIVECNNIIAGFQTIPTRHNHYMHQITEQSCPQSIDVMIFNREAEKIIVEDSISFNGNVSSEVFQSRPLDNAELNQFRLSHVNKTFTDDKLFELVSKYNNATNTRCFGNNEDAVLLADSFSELTLGYLLCEMRTVKGESRETVLESYAKMKTTSELLTELAKDLGLSNTQFKTRSGYNEWFTYCRTLRNDLTHRFMTANVNGDESLSALHYSGALISKTCHLIQQRFPLDQYPDFSDKLDLLISASYFVDVLHRGSKAN